MILKIILKHSYFGGDADIDRFIGPDELEAGADIASHFPEDDRSFFNPFKARYIDDGNIEITFQDTTCCFPADEYNFFETPWIEKFRRRVVIEDEEYTNIHEVKASVELLPYVRTEDDGSTILSIWDAMEGKPLEVSVDKQTLEASETDCDAAYRIAECIEQQYPEALEVVYDYMRSARELGSSKAEEWLKEYLGDDDGRFDAYS